MDAIHKEIRAWLLTQPEWLQEAAERLLKQGTLDNADLQAICALLKTPGGQAVTRHRVFDGLVPTPQVGGELRLSSIGEVLGIENLVPRQPLVFGTGNLTVIYGHNGSGKSSYTRILKKASGNPRANDLKSNVFQAAPAGKSCRIAYEMAGQSGGCDWDATGAPIDAIRALDVFDSDEAAHYLRSESAAAYTPPVVGMFEALAAACDQIKIMLQNEQDRLVSTLPALPPDYAATISGQRYKELGNTSEAAREFLLTWTEAEAQKLGDLTERLKVADHSALARQKRATKAQADQIVTNLKRAAQAFGTESIQAIRALRTSAEHKRQIAKEAAQVASAKLDGVGAPTWQALWEAARVYSQTAYPGMAFPVTNDSRCVLCHQELAPDAQQRLHEFESFVQGKLEGEAKAAERAHTEALNALPAIPSEEQIRTQCQAAGLSLENWVPYLSSFWSSASVVKSGLDTFEHQGLVDAVQDVSNAEKMLLTYTGQLEEQALKHEQDAQGFDRVQAAKDKLALEAKQWVAQQADAVRNEVERLKQVKVFDGWKSLANSRVVSAKASAVSEKVITQSYITRFNRELQLLGASRLRVELVKTKTEKGKVLHRLRLKDVKNKHPIELVLSEGERRIISLAAFLADVADKPQPAPFVFDDPISSLDHDFEWSVASRLAELAKNRQVLVFTHRLSLYGAMEDVAKKAGDEWKKQHFQQLCIESYSGVAGHPVDQATWNAKTEKANNILLARLDQAKRAGEAAGGDAYRGLAQGICSDFRKLLERTVEDDLLNEVVKRHRRSVTTDNRIGALHFIEQDDCQLIDGLMTKYSCYEHSQSQEVPVFIPEEPVLRADLEALRQWRKGFIARRKGGVA